MPHPSPPSVVPVFPELSFQMWIQWALGHRLLGEPSTKPGATPSLSRAPTPAALTCLQAQGCLCFCLLACMGEPPAWSLSCSSLSHHPHETLAQTFRHTWHPGSGQSPPLHPSCGLGHLQGASPGAAFLCVKWPRSCHFREWSSKCEPWSVRSPCSTPLH